MNFKRCCVLSVLACTLSSAGVTLAADLSVNGQIQSGGACGVALGNGGVIDLGNLSNNDIPPGSYPVIIRDMPLTISCQHPTKVGVDTIDNRTSTATPHGGFGLGNPAIGYYSITSPPYGYNSRADGERVYAIWRDKGQTTWDGAGDSNGLWGPRTTMSWKEKGEAWEPVTFKTLTDVLKVHITFLNKIALTDEFEIDGSATLELVYL